MCAIGSQACPYLGRCEDPENYYSFPTVDNCCHAEKRPYAVEPPYQARICLEGWWSTCLRYKAAMGMDMGDESAGILPAAPAAKRSPSPKLIAGIVAAGVILLVALFLIVRPRPGPSHAVLFTSTPTSSQQIAATRRPTHAPEGPTLAAVGFQEGTRTAQPAATATPTAAPSLTPTRILRPTATRTPTTTPTPTRAPSRTPSPTLSPTPSRTPRPISTPTLAPTLAPTQTPSPTSSPAAGATGLPTATSTPLPAPTLLAPLDGQAYSLGEEIVLVWKPLTELPAEAYYEVSLSYLHLGDTWYDDVPWTRQTSWPLSDHTYLVDLSDDGWFRWSVQVMRQTGVDADGNPVGVALSAASEAWSLRWMAPTGGGSGPGTPPTPPPPPP